jgi:hypothetical protein
LRLAAAGQNPMSVTFSGTIRRSWAKGLIREGALGQINYLYSNRLNIGKIRAGEYSLELRAPIFRMLWLLSGGRAVSCVRGRVSQITVV